MGQFLQSALKEKQNLLFGLVLFCVFFGVVFFLWPGTIRPDTLSQLSQAKSGIYNDANPPVMAMFWHFLYVLLPGSGLMFLTHMVLLYLTLLLCGIIFKPLHLKWFYAVIFFWPQVFFSAQFVSKDIAFAFSFLMVASVLAFYTTKKEPMPWFVALVLFVLLFYGTGVKYQARFVLPIYAFWFVSCLRPQDSMKNLLIKATIVFSLVFGATQAVQHLTNVRQTHFWQWVKLFDLAAISLKEKKDLIPAFNKQDAQGDFMAELAKRFNPERVNEIGSDPKIEPLLRLGENDRERDQLWDAWFNAVKTYPLSYLKHRLRLLVLILKKSPIKGLGESSQRGEVFPSLAQRVIEFGEGKGFLQIVKALTPFIYYLPMMIFYTFFGAVYARQTAFAKVLFLLNGSGLFLMLALVPFSMASDVRYLYFTMCSFHFSHPFFMRAMRQVKKNIGRIQ